MNFLNVFFTKDNSLILLFRIYYSIALLFVLTILTSLIFSQNVYDKQIKVLYPNNSSKNENLDHLEKMKNLSDALHAPPAWGVKQLLECHLRRSPRLDTQVLRIVICSPDTTTYTATWLTLIHNRPCRRSTQTRSRWSPYH